MDKATLLEVVARLKAVLAMPEFQDDYEKRTPQRLKLHREYVSGFEAALSNVESMLAECQ